MTHRTGTRHLSALTIAACILIGGSPLAVGQVRFGVGVAIPGVSIGINIPAYPELAPIPGYPVYYAPQLSTNLFFYDGLYWVFTGDSWYYSSWYDGPWYLAQPELVPDFILRVPIHYYRRPPPYFLGWNRAAPPRWGEHWGRAWEQHRRGWDRWDRRSVPPRAPLPNYQRGYPHDRYPGAGGQRNLENRYYHFRPRDPGDRARMQQAPPPGRLVAPQPGRRVPERRPEGPPGAHRTPPGPMQRSPGFTRPSPPERAPGRPDSSRGTGSRSPGQRADPAPHGRQARDARDARQPRGGAGRGDRPNDRPPS
jgi:hypothetical protein